MRDTSRDGFGNRVEVFILTHFPRLWRLVMAIAPLRRWVNKKIIGRAAQRTRSRPHALSSMPVRGDASRSVAGYTSWESLTDRNWFSRHLAPRTLPHYPALPDMAELFQLRPEGAAVSKDSTVLFLSFAQWFTDGFLMTDASERRRTFTSHHIDLNPLYGLSREQSQALRLMSEKPGEKGRMKVEEIDGEIYAPKLHDETGAVKPEFKSLRYPLGLDNHLRALPPDRAAELRKGMFAFAGERANVTPYTSMINILFLREHNRLAKLLETANPQWDDERVFQTARNINVVQLIKIVIEEYINHISPYHFQLTADPSVCWNESWNKPNWIPIEFDLLYRWHSLVPDHFVIGGKVIPAGETLYDNSHLVASGLVPLAVSASGQQAWEVGLFNTAPFLLPVELAGIEQSRIHRIGTYNDYREAFGYPRVTRFEQITGDKRKVEALRRLYKDKPDDVEYFVGLFAEDVSPRAAVPPLVGRMVALDAFTQALTNPLLAEHVFNESTFTKEGMREIAATRCLQDVVNRNLGPGQKPASVAMTYQAGKTRAPQTSGTGESPSAAASRSESISVGSPAGT